MLVVGGKRIMPAEERITVQITEPPIIPNYCLDFVPSWAGQLHYQPQALESARQGPGPSARGTGRGLPAHDLRREPRGGGRGAGRLRTQVAAALQGRGLKLWQAGDELFTFTAFPSSQWKALRTTNALERVNEEFRRRAKTQASLPNEEAVLLLLFGLLRSGQVKLRHLVGWHDLTALSERPEAA